MKKLIGSMIFKCVNDLRTDYNKKGVDLAKFLDRSASYVTRCYKTAGTRAGTEIKPKSFRIEPPEVNQVVTTEDDRLQARREHRKYRLFALVCWLMERLAEPDGNRILEFYNWLHEGPSKGLTFSEFSTKVLEASVDADAVFTGIKTPGPLKGTCNQKPKQKQQELPFGQLGKPEKEAEVVEPKAIASPAQMGGPQEAPKPEEKGFEDFDMARARVIFMLIRRRAKTTGGLFSTRILREELLKEGFTIERASKYLRSRKVKERIIDRCEVSGISPGGMDPSCRGVEDITNIPGVLIYDEECGWCMDRALFGGYCMENHNRLYTMATIVLTEEPEVPEAPLLPPLTEERVIELMAIALAPKLNQIATAQQESERRLEVKFESKLETAIEGLRAEMSKPKSGWRSSVARVPRYYYSKKVLWQGLKRILDRPFIGTCALPETAAQRLIDYHALFSQYLTRWFLTPGKDTLYIDLSIGVVPFNKLERLFHGSPKEHSPRRVLGTPGFVNKAAYMCVVPADTVYDNSDILGVSYDTYYSVYAFGLAMKVLLQHLQYAAAKTFKAPGDPFWPSIAKAQATQMDRKIYDELTAVVTAAGKLDTFLSVLEDECEAIIRHKIKDEADVFNIGKTCWKVEKGRSSADGKKGK